MGRRQRAEAALNYVNSFREEGLPREREGLREHRREHRRDDRDFVNNAGFGWFVVLFM